MCHMRRRIHVSAQRRKDRQLGILSVSYEEEDTCVI
jgi:hypothetical protein